MEQNVISIKIDLTENKDGFYGYFNMGKYCVSTAENKKSGKKYRFPYWNLCQFNICFSETRERSKADFVNLQNIIYYVV